MTANRSKAAFSVVVAVLLFGVGHYWNIVRTEWSTKMSSKVPSEVYHEAAPKDNSTDQLKATNSIKHLATKHHATNNPKELPLQVINGIKKMVVFAGNGRTGSSIIGSLMDAHPHVINTTFSSICQNLQKLHLSATKASRRIYSMLSMLDPKMMLFIFDNAPIKVTHLV